MRRSFCLVAILVAVAACGGSPPPPPEAAEPPPTVNSPPPPDPEPASPAEATDPAAPAATPVPAATQPAEVAPAPSSAAPPTPPAPADVERNAEGKITSSKGDKVTIELDGDLPAVGATGDLHRKLQEAVMFFPAGAWLGIAAVKVEKVEGKKVTLTITERKSSITINGRQVDHYKPNTTIRLTWTAKP